MAEPPTVTVEVAVKDAEGAALIVGVIVAVEEQPPAPPVTVSV